MRKKGNVIFIICMLTIYIVIKYGLIASVAVRTYQNYFTKIYRMVYTVKDSYSPYMELMGAWMKEDEPNTICIRFRMDEHYEDVIDKLDMLNEKLVDLFLCDPDSPYRQYNLEIDFYSTWGEFLNIYTCDNGNTTRLWIDIYGISQKDIVQYFPETMELKCTAPYYDNIEELQGFYDLRVLDLDQKMTKEDMDYIRSIYPNCYIVPTYVGDDYIIHSYDMEE